MNISIYLVLVRFFQNGYGDPNYMYYGTVVIFKLDRDDFLF